jgi:hypothetical protein
MDIQWQWIISTESIYLTANLMLLQQPCGWCRSIILFPPQSWSKLVGIWIVGSRTRNSPIKAAFRMGIAATRHWDKRLFWLCSFRSFTFQEIVWSIHYVHSSLGHEVFSSKYRLRDIVSQDQQTDKNYPWSTFCCLRSMVYTLQASGHQLILFLASNSLWVSSSDHGFVII